MKRMNAFPLSYPISSRRARVRGWVDTMTGCRYVEAMAFSESSRSSKFFPLSTIQWEVLGSIGQQPMLKIALKGIAI